ncbi:RISC-loading complex subunit tarbp2-like isoform X2 [Trichoplusia ni]|nr:RISC-loading complex subunit tarbp2-like isoform X2 [Trichoplusia ni]XP_026747490.1 RISC-loading complex subunit tarbp2-like isoform X2 [Trichoplusia ni]XP_026747491.1 RISC-loading complex subunit tarbp2-like isoform X2 [Trichoplusia ni]XP_026747492.1 RISC-loading complex subunit tarbp2-like isoform X2 [Trichoplusia ni]
MKTAVTVLQEMMVKLGLTPEYECISQSGPKHQALFEYRCNALGVVVTASARSKKEAKQEVARIMLQQLSARGHPVPPPYSVPIAMQEDSPFSAGGPGDTRSYVALLRELCEEYRLTGVTYELVGDTGPPHLRHFTVRARIGQHERFATATTKKMARQMAAEKLYTYLRENLARVTRDFNEEDALVRAHEKAMERYHENEEAPRRPDLGLRVADYHIGLAALLGRPSYTEAYRDSTMSIDEDTRSLARSALEQGRSQSPTRALQAVAETLGLELQASCLEREGEAPLCVLQVTGCSPELAFAEPTAAAAAGAAMDYVRRALTELCQ